MTFPAVKRVKREIQGHPLGVKPLGNALLSNSIAHSRVSTLGPYLGSLSDELLMHVIQQLDSGKDVLSLSHTCKSLFAYCWYDENWKYLLHESGQQVDKWYGSWRRTFWRLSEQDEARIDCSNKVFSDVLFRPFQCAEINYDDLIDVKENPVPVLDSVTEEEYNEKWVSNPFIIKNGPICDWNRKQLVKDYGRHVFAQEYMSWTLDVYNQYMDHNKDESPLYLFDCGETTNQLKYEVPLKEIFDDQDYFKLLGQIRPDYRWLILGPARSGSVFHKDPNGTSAWNSVISGRKYWIMFPPKAPPPGVSTDVEQSEVTQPISVAEWFLGGFYKQTLAERDDFLQAITYPGETMYVPAGWWHLVVNLEESLAMTGNFVPEKKLPEILDFLKNHSKNISGFKNGIDRTKVYEIFIKELQKAHPQVAAKALDGLALIERGSKWDQLTASKNEEFNFSFAFAEADSDSDDP